MAEFRPTMSKSPIDCASGSFWGWRQHSIFRVEVLSTGLFLPRYNSMVPGLGDAIETSFGQFWNCELHGPTERWGANAYYHHAHYARYGTVTSREDSRPICEFLETDLVYKREF